MSSRHSSSSTPNAFDPDLLRPIVRSKRTAMACTECRRRQVKCSGNQPRCERCQRKDIECTYMSLSEQRGVTSNDQNRSGTPQFYAGHSVHPSYYSGHHGHAQNQQHAMHGYPGASTYAQAQGGPARAQSPALTAGMGQHAQHGSQAMQNFGGAAMAYQAAYSQGGQQVPPQGYAAGYANAGVPAPYHAYPTAVPSGYTAPQPAAMTDNQPSVAYDVNGTPYMVAPNGEIVQVDPSQLAAYTNAGSSSHSQYKAQ